MIYNLQCCGSGFAFSGCPYPPKIEDPGSKKMKKKILENYIFSLEKSNEIIRSESMISFR